MAKMRKYFPEECWELIFSRLHRQSDLASVSSVCNQFLSLTNNLRLHLKVIHHGTLTKLIHRFPNLNSIDLTNFSGDIHPVLVDLANYMPNLEQLDLSTLPIKGLKELGLLKKGLRVLKCRKLTSIGDSCLSVIAESFPFLEELDIAYPGTGGLKEDFFNQLPNRSKFGVVTDSGIEVLSVKLRNLRKIDLSGNFRITDRSLVALAKNCLNLQAIEVEHTRVTLKGVLSIQRACASLIWISVSEIHVGISSSGFQCFATSSRALQSLEVSYSSISDGFIFLVAKASLPLHRLSFASCTGFTLSGISSLLCAYRTLTCLSLVAVDSLSDESMNDLTQYLRNLVTINLSHCVKLTISTFFTLARNCPSLEAVTMDNTGLGMKEAYFHNGVKNPRIRTVSLKFNARLNAVSLKFNARLNADSLKEVALICPNLESLDVYGCNSLTEAGIAYALELCDHIRNLEFGHCPLIKHIGNGPELPNLELINAAESALSDEGLAIIGSRCSHLLKLNLENCEGVTAEGIQAMVKISTSLREINLKRCCQVGDESLYRIVCSSSSLKRVFLRSRHGFVFGLSGFSSQNGCLVSLS